MERENLSYKLEAFEGPLELLLALIGKKKIEIFDINISLILEQYMAYLDAMQEMDMEITADFLSMASYLIQIKSRMLLPFLKEQEEDPRAELVRALEEYRQVQQAARILMSMEKENEGTFTREPDLPERGPREPYALTHGSEELYAAFMRVLQRTGRKLPPPVMSFSGIVGRERISISSKIRGLLERFSKKRRFGFYEAFKGCADRGEIVAVFLAILELAKENCLAFSDADRDNGDLRVRIVHMPDEEQMQRLCSADAWETQEERDVGDS